MKPVRTTMLAAVLSASLITLGCVGVSASKSYQQNPTIGQQLTDLKKAHDQGAINDAEYERLKQGIIGEAESSKRR